METIIYKTSLDLTAKLITTFVIVLFGFIIYKSIEEIISAESGYLTFIPFSLLILFLIFSVLYMYMLRPLQYEVNDQVITIKRQLNSKNIDIKEIKTVILFPKEGVTVRTWASGGVFGYFGKFYNKKLGHLTYYGTRLDNKILITIESDTKIVLTPDDIEMCNKLASMI